MVYCKIFEIIQRLQYSIPLVVKCGRQIQPRIKSLLPPTKSPRDHNKAVRSEQSINQGSNHTYHFFPSPPTLSRGNALSFWGISPGAQHSLSASFSAWTQAVLTDLRSLTVWPLLTVHLFSCL